WMRVLSLSKAARSECTVIAITPFVMQRQRWGPFSAAISIDDEEFGAGLRRRAMRRIAAFGDLVTHPRPQLERSAITKFGIEFAVDDIQHMAEVAPVIRHIAGAVFDQPHAQITDGEGAPGGFSRLARMDSHGHSAPVRDR